MSIEFKPTIVKPVKYPVVRSHIVTGMAVLFVSKHAGVVIREGHQNQFPLGKYLNDWESCLVHTWIPAEVTISG